MFIRNQEDIEKLLAIFDQLEPTNILIFVDNLNDGIGDSKNGLDAYRDIKKIATKHNVKLMVVSSENRLSAMKIIANNIMPNDKVHVIDLIKS